MSGKAGEILRKPTKPKSSLNSSKKELMWLIARSKPIVLLLFIIVFSNTIISVTGVLFVMVSRGVIDAATGGNTTELINNGIVMVATSLSKLALESFDKVMTTRATLKLDSRLKDYIFKKLLRKDFTIINTYESGDLLTRMSDDVDTVSRGVLGIVPGFASMATQLVAAFYALFSLDTTFAFISLLIGPIVLLIGKVTSKWVRKLHLDAQENLSATRTFLQETFKHILAVKSYLLEDHLTKKHQDLLDKNVIYQRRKGLYSTIAGFGLSLGYWIGYIFAIVWGSYRLTTGSITFGTMSAFMQLVGQVQSPFIGISNKFPGIYSTLASVSRLAQISEIPREEHPGSETSEPSKEEIASLVLDSVFFSYSENPILKNVSLVLEPGDFIILDGKQGMGKTTIAHLLLGVLTPDNGQIYLRTKKENILSIGTDTRKYFSLVPEGNTIISGNIEGNILFGAPLDEKLLNNSAATANITDFIEQLPNRYKTKIGENGRGLSEGQCQRLAIARAIYRDTPIIIFDESTTSLAVETESKLIKDIYQSSRHKICIFISNRRLASDEFNRRFILADGDLCEISI